MDSSRDGLSNALGIIEIGDAKDIIVGGGLLVDIYYVWSAEVRCTRSCWMVL